MYARIPRNEFLGYRRAKPSGLQSFQPGRALPRSSPGFFPPERSRFQRDPEVSGRSRTRDNPGPACGVLSCRGTTTRGWKLHAQLAALDEDSANGEVGIENDEISRQADGD